MRMTSYLLRIYDPEECGIDGAPLDWKKCRACDGTGRRVLSPLSGLLPGTTAAVLRSEACPVCEGHGSLKALALESIAKRSRGGKTFTPHQKNCIAYNTMGGHCDCHRALLPFRCEGCGHPMNDGIWNGADLDGDGPEEVARFWTAQARKCLRLGTEPFWGAKGMPVYWSPCDEGCRHGGPVLARSLASVVWDAFPTDPPRPIDQMVRSHDVKASWRQVGIRRMGWAHDLRPERLAILCLRCYAERNSTDKDNS